LKNYKLTHEASQNFLDKLIKYDWCNIIYIEKLIIQT
jgi:hypothetical protein